MKNAAQRVATRYMARIARRANRLRLASASLRMTPAVKRPATAAFKRKGLDGNGRFRKAEQGYSLAVDVLQDLGVELDEVVSSHQFRRESNEFTIRLAYTNQEDIFSPIPISNSMLVIQYTKLEDDRYEVLAYLS